MPTTTNLQTLTINHVASQEVYDAMAAQNLINENELYLVPGDISIATDNTPGGTENSNAVITSGAAYAGFQTKANKENAVYFVKGTQTASTNAWTGVLSAVNNLYDGLTIAYFLPKAGTSDSATLTLTLGTNIQTAAEPVYYTSTSRATTHYGASSVVLLTWISNATTGYSAVGSANGRWLRADYADGNTIPATSVGTDAATAAKAGSHTYYVLKANNYTLVTLRYSNTAQSALTLNINKTGAKPIYINGVASSSTNYTLPAGTYLVYYDGTNYYFRTDGKITGSITGTVNGHSVNADVPNDAVFTDTTYSFTSGTTNGSIKITSNNIQDTVNVYTLPTASSSALGGVKIGYTENGKNYPVQLDNEKMYVNVPWTNVNGSYLTADDVSPATTVPELAWGGTATLGTVANKKFKVTMPSNPDTHYESALVTTSTNSGKANAIGGTNSVYLNLVENDTVRNAHQIIGSGTVTVGSDADGKITIAGAGPTITLPESVPTLSWGGTTTIGTIDNQQFKVTMPANPNSNTTYTLTQDANDGHKITLTPSSGNGNTVTIPDENYYHTTGTWSGLTYSADNTHAPNIQLKFTIPTGADADTVARGDHNHDTRYYTKTEVDGKVASVLKYKGTKANVAALPSSDNTTGDVWHVTADGGEYAWNGSGWEPLGMVVDLSGYAQLSGANFTGPVNFGDSVTADDVTTGTLVVTGNASFTNNIQANTINGVAVGEYPQFTDTTYTTTQSAKTNITISNHSTTSIGSASGWSAGSFTRGTFSGGSGSFSTSVSNHIMSFSHTHTAATHAADSFTAPALTITPTTVTTGATHTVNETAHTHSI